MEYDILQIEKQLERIEEKVDAVYRSSEKMRKYFLIAVLISAAVIVVPLLILPLLLPYFLQSVSIPAGF